jgi:hypothetical protein
VHYIITLWLKIQKNVHEEKTKITVKVVKFQGYTVLSITCADIITGCSTAEQTLPSGVMQQYTLLFNM